VVASLGAVGGVGGDGERAEQMEAFFGLERTLVAVGSIVSCSRWASGLLMETQIIEHSSFETLESLADRTVTQLQAHRALPGAQVRLWLEKPRAIAFADAPAVEVFRVVHGTRTPAASSSESAPLRIIKPYHHQK